MRDMTTLCGKCGKRILDPGEPAGLLGTPVCDCTDMVPSAGPPESEPIWTPEQHPVIADMPAYRTAMSATIRAHAIDPKDPKANWCDMCRKIGNTFGCAKCNGGPTRVSW